MAELPTIVTDAEGVWCLDGPDRRWGIEWDEIWRVNIGKIDLIDDSDITVELDFEFGEFVELDGASPGFDEAMGVIASRLAGFPSDWRQQGDRIKPGDAGLELWAKATSPGTG